MTRFLRISWWRLQDRIDPAGAGRRSVRRVINATRPLGPSLQALAAATERATAAMAIAAEGRS